MSNIQDEIPLEFLSFLEKLLAWFAANNDEISLFCDKSAIFSPIGNYEALQGIFPL